jgi:hypothetical protein
LFFRKAKLCTTLFFFRGSYQHYNNFLYLYCINRLKKRDDETPVLLFRSGCGSLSVFILPKRADTPNEFRETTGIPTMLGITVKAGTVFWNARYRSTRKHKREGWFEPFTQGAHAHFYALVHNAAFDYYDRAAPEYSLQRPRNNKLQLRYFQSLLCKPPNSYG